MYILPAFFACTRIVFPVHTTNRKNERNNELQNIVGEESRGEAERWLPACYGDLERQVWWSMGQAVPLPG
jgi:hypothetical protein